MNLPPDSIGKILLEKQMSLQLHGLFSEVKDILIEHVIINVEDFSKQQWKDFVIEKVNKENFKELLSLMRQSSKVKETKVLEKLVR